MKKLCIVFTSLMLIFASGCVSEEVVEKPDKKPEKQEEVKEEVVEDSEEEKIDRIINSMTLHEKVSQLIVVSPESIAEVEVVSAAGEYTKNVLQEFPVGGILYSAKNMITPDQVSQMLANVKSYMKITPMLTCDEEGGRVNRLMNTLGTTYIGPMLEYESEGESKAYYNAYTIASDMKALGFNADMAPVADVWSNPENTVIGDRAYSRDFNSAASLIPSAVKGFHDGGVATAIKHFPGHGDTYADSHDGAVYVSKTLDEIRANELLPFKAGIAAGTDMVMVGHLIVSDVDDKPATLSYKIVSELLREELGFDGVVITDGLQMGAMVGYYSSGYIACEAIKAGVDMLLCPENPYEAASALETAVQNQEISEARINESVKRILKMKKARGMIDLDKI